MRIMLRQPESGFGSVGRGQVVLLRDIHGPTFRVATLPQS